MIIWLNGPYGVGKSTLAEQLQVRISPSFLFDAELVGDAVRENYPLQFFKETYEEFPLWIQGCCQLLKELDTVYDGCIIVPMTLIRPQSAILIIDRLRSENVLVKHILLEADSETIRQRILTRGEEEDCWCMQQIGKCIEGQKVMPCDMRICALQSPEILADLILEKINH